MEVLELLRVNILTLARQSFHDLSGTVNIGLLDAIVSFLELNSDVGRSAQEILVELRSRLKIGLSKSSMDIWYMFETILSHGKAWTKSIFLKDLKEVIDCSWPSFSYELQDRLKVYINNLIIRHSSAEAINAKTDSQILTQLGAILIKVLGYEWPARWEMSVVEFINVAMVSKSNVYYAISMGIIQKVLPLAMKAVTDHTFLERHCSNIQKLCMCVIQRNLSDVLRWKSIGILNAFLTAVPLTTVPPLTCEPKFLDLLLNCFLLPSDETKKILVLQCLTKVVQVFELDEYHEELVVVHEEVLKYIQSQNNFGTISGEPGMSQHFSCFLTSYYKNHMMLLEDWLKIDANRDLLFYGLDFLISMLDTDDEEHRKLHLEFWCSFVLGLSDLDVRHGTGQEAKSELPLFNGARYSLRLPCGNWQNLLRSLLSKLRNSMIKHMAKLEEVLVIKDENGKIVCGTMGTDVLGEHKIMSDIMVCLTQLDAYDTEGQEGEAGKMSY